MFQKMAVYRNLGMQNFNLRGFLFTRVIITFKTDLRIFFPQFLISRGRGEVKATTSSTKKAEFGSLVSAKEPLLFAFS